LYHVILQLQRDKTTIQIKCKEVRTMRNNMMRDCRMAMSRVPGVDRETMREVLEMRAAAAGITKGNVVSTLLSEHDTVKMNFRSWISSRI